MTISPVATFLQPNYSGDQPGAPQTATGYPLAVDAAIRAMTRGGDMFAPRQSPALGMTVSLDPGHVWVGTALTEVGFQTSGTITAPVTYPRIDRAVIDRLTGLVSIITGTENASPTPPAIPSGSVPIAQIALQISTTAITNSLISDERDFTALGGVPGAFGPQTSLASASISDLGTVASQNVLMTGTATISGLGSSAHINAPLYLVKFAAALTLTYNATSLILPGAVNITTAAGDAGLFEYLGSGNWACRGYFRANGLATIVTPAIVPYNYLSGLNLSNDGSLPNSVLDIAAGQCADSTNAVFITLGAFTKSTAGSWAAGSGANGMGTGLTIAGSTWYHVFAIINNGLPDIYFDVSINAGQKPAGTTALRRIGSFRTDGLYHILPFTQDGDFFYWGAVVQETLPSITSTAALVTMTTPPDVKTRPMFRFANTTGQILITSPDETDVAVGSLTATPGYDVGSGIEMPNFNDRYTNTSSQLRVRGTISSSTAYMWTRGWIDTRGK